MSRLWLVLLMLAVGSCHRRSLPVEPRLPRAWMEVVPDQEMPDLTPRDQREGCPFMADFCKSSWLHDA